MLRACKESTVSHKGKYWKCGETKVECDRKKDKSIVFHDLTENSNAPFELTPYCETESQ